jgi:thioredoxin:protein disulfide reductase
MTALLAPVLALMLSSVEAQTFSTGNSPFGESRFLPVDQAFQFYTSLDSAERLSIHWQIAPGYYLYQDKFRFAAVLTEDTEAIELPAALPEGIAHNDEFFGDVLVYYSAASIPISLPPRALTDFTLLIQFQGCSEDGLCYPLQKREIEILQQLPPVL